MSEADDLREDFVREFKVLAEDGTLVPLTTTAYRAWCLLSAVQLASRHPEAMATAPMQVAVEMARHIQTLIATTPALKRVAEMGWDQTHDY